MVVNKQGGTAKTALDATNGTIDNKTKTRVYSRCTLEQGVEMVIEQSDFDQNFIDSRGKYLGYLKSRSVSRRGASLDAGTDVTINIAGPSIGFDDVQDLWKRKGGGGGGGHGGSSTSGGHSSDGSSSDGGSTSGGKGSDSSSAGGRTTTGSGVTPNFGGGRFYGGGASVPYSSGARSPSGISPVLLGVAAASIFPGLWLYDVYSYPYSNLYTFHNESAKINQTKPVICLCQEYCECGCDENTNSTFMNDILGDGSYTTLNRSLVTVGIVNGTSTIIINGTLPNGTTASGGSVSANTGGSLRFGLSSSLGYLIVIGTVLAAVFV